MSLTFTWKDIPERAHGLTFDDVLMVPNRSDVRSRREPDLSTRLTKHLNMGMPFISANMDTVTESAMAVAMNNLKGFGIIHRFLSIPDQLSEVDKAKKGGVNVIGASIGVNDDFKERAEALVKAGVKVLTIDIAHGHSTAMMETLKWVKDRFGSDVDVIAGNVATPEATEELIESGADAIKVGIGPGSMCTTRIITGAGIPQLTAIAWCAQAAASSKTPIIADGGLKASGDIVKALSAGADSVMLGSLLSGTMETPGEIRNGKKQYRGMASKSAQVSWRGGVPEGMAPEGESTYVPIKGHVADVVNELAGGLRSGMSYLNALNIEDMKTKARFMEMTSMGRTESGAHGVR